MLKKELKRKEWGLDSVQPAQKAVIDAYFPSPVVEEAEPEVTEPEVTEPTEPETPAETEPNTDDNNGEG